MADPAYVPTLVWANDTLVWANRTLMWDEYVPPPETLGDVVTVKADRARTVSAKADRARRVTVLANIRRP